MLLSSLFLVSVFFFFFNDTATTEIYTLSLHDALPIYRGGALPTGRRRGVARGVGRAVPRLARAAAAPGDPRRHHALGRSEEHTSELQSRLHLVCRLLLEKKKKKKQKTTENATQANYTI